MIHNGKTGHKPTMDSTLETALSYGDEARGKVVLRGRDLVALAGSEGESFETVAALLWQDVVPESLSAATLGAARARLFPALLPFERAVRGFTASAAIQLKGGTSGIIVEKCRFLNAGERPLNIGGSTGLAYFRPSGTKHEAASIVVRDNHIEGSPCAAAFVGVDGAEFSNNTILYPTKWIFRILQETREPGFAPCRNVLIKNNRFTFRRSQVQTDVNLSDGTAPETFRFESNHWLAEDRPTASQPKLPTQETAGTYGQPIPK